MGRSLVLVRSSSMLVPVVGRWLLVVVVSSEFVNHLPFRLDPTTMDDAEREDILNDALELFGGEKVDESGVIMYGPLRLSVAQKVVSVVLLMFAQKPVIALTSPSSSKAKCVLNFMWP